MIIWHVYWKMKNEWVKDSVTHKQSQTGKVESNWFFTAAATAQNRCDALIKFGSGDSLSGSPAPKGCFRYDWCYKSIEMMPFSCIQLHTESLKPGEVIVNAMVNLQQKWSFCQSCDTPNCSQTTKSKHVYCPRRLFPNIAMEWLKTLWFFKTLSGHNNLLISWVNIGGRKAYIWALKCQH